MTQKFLLTVCILLFGAVVPYLEINHTHVFNPTWPAHARLHEVWQLVTNSTIAVFCLWRVWWRCDLRLPSLLTIFVTGGFLVAYLIRDGYGGSMLHSDGTERLVLGINIGVLGFGITIGISTCVLLIDFFARGKHRTDGM